MRTFFPAASGYRSVIVVKVFHFQRHVFLRSKRTAFFFFFFGRTGSSKYRIMALRRHASETDLPWTPPLEKLFDLFGELLVLGHVIFRAAQP